MNKVFLFGATLLATSIFYSPNISAAATLPAPQMIRLSDTHVLFSTTFKVGYLNRSATLSLATKQGASTTALNYHFIDETGKIIPTESQAVILAKDVSVKNHSYSLPYGSSEFFTLYAVALIPKTAPTRALAITAIPHTATDLAANTTVAAKLQSTLPVLTTPFSK